MFQDSWKAYVLSERPVWERRPFQDEFQRNEEVVQEIQDEFDRFIREWKSSNRNLKLDNL